ncbi:hypothetical protein EV363DRAFT_1294391 [Boletus edulis]|nr:hypothetical protein EV363DRAFT_1294391 [Boletus edulis]
MFRTLGPLARLNTSETLVTAKMKVRVKPPPLRSLCNGKPNAPRVIPKHHYKGMSATRVAPVSFPGETTITKQTVEGLLSKQSYVDHSSNVHVLVLLQEGKLPSTVHVPEKYFRMLHIISYRYDVYRHTATAIQATKTSCDTTTAMQKLARILYYLDNVRTVYIARARWGNVADEGWFSPELEYHMWLDFVERAYHNDACASIKERVGVTFEYVVQREQPDISSFIEWDKYIEMHNLRFNMCGLGIPLGKDELPVPQAAASLSISNP